MAAIEMDESCHVELDLSKICLKKVFQTLQRAIVKICSKARLRMRSIVQEPEDVQRNQLFQSKAQVKEGQRAKQNRNSAYDIGKDLEGQPTLLDTSALPGKSCIHTLVL